jgi:hypothetical protein
MPKEETKNALPWTFAPFFAQVNAPLDQCFGVATGGIETAWGVQISFGAG